MFQAKAIGVECMDVEALKKMNKNKKLVKKLGEHSCTTVVTAVHACALLSVRF